MDTSDVSFGIKVKFSKFNLIFHIDIVMPIDSLNSISNDIIMIAINSKYFIYQRVRVVIRIIARNS